MKSIITNRVVITLAIFVALALSSGAWWKWD